MHRTLCFPPFLFPLFLPPTTLLFVHLMPLCPCPKAPWVGGGKQKQRAGLLAWRSGSWPYPERSKGHWVLWLSGEHFAADGRFVCDVEMRLSTKAPPLSFSAWLDSQYFSQTRPCSYPVPKGLARPITMVQVLHCGVRSPCVPKCRVNSICGGPGGVSITMNQYKVTRYKHHKNSFKKLSFKAKACEHGGTCPLDKL